MSKHKAISTYIIKKVIQSQGQYAEKKFLDTLDDNEKEQYIHVMPTAWFDQDKEGKFFQSIIHKAAIYLYPDEPHPERQLGKLCAREALTSVYSTFIKIPEVTYLIQRLPFLLKTYHPSWEFKTQDQSDHDLSFTLHTDGQVILGGQYYLAGYIEVLFELVGVKKIKIEFSQPEPLKLAYHISWENLL